MSSSVNYCDSDSALFFDTDDQMNKVDFSATSDEDDVMQWEPVRYRIQGKTVS